MRLFFASKRRTKRRINSLRRIMRQDIPETHKTVAQRNFLKDLSLQTWYPCSHQLFHRNSFTLRCFHLFWVRTKPHKVASVTSYKFFLEHHFTVAAFSFTTSWFKETLHLFIFEPPIEASKRNKLRPFCFDFPANFGSYKNSCVQSLSF